MTQEMIEKKDVWRTLKTNFTEKEKLAMAEQISGCIRERNRLEEEFVSVKKQYASDIGKQEAEISSLAERFNTGWEMRRVECVELKDFNNGSVRVYRRDTGDLTEERPMSAEERQQTLPLEEKNEAGGLFLEFGTKTDAEAIIGDGMGGKLPPESLQDEREADFMPESVVMVGSERIKDFDGLKTPENELPEDENEFYREESPKKKRGPKAKKIELP
jgi:hypothetical protein